jgi:hypothetical protein
MSHYFTLLDEVTRYYRRFNAEGKELTLRMTAPSLASKMAQDPARNFANSVDKLFEYLLRDLELSDMVGIFIYNADNQQDKPIGLSFKRKGQISRDVPWSVFEKVTKSNARYQVLGTHFSHIFCKDACGFWEGSNVEGKTHVRAG